MEVEAAYSENARHLVIGNKAICLLKGAARYLSKMSMAVTSSILVRLKCSFYYIWSTEPGDFIYAIYSEIIIGNTDNVKNLEIRLQVMWWNTWKKASQYKL